MDCFNLVMEPRVSLDVIALSDIPCDSASSSSSAGSASVCDGVNALVLVGKKCLLLDSAHSPVSKQVLTRMLEGPSSSFLLPNNQTSLVLVALPTEASRINCPARPDAITSKVASALPSSGKMVIIVHLEDAKYAEACAVAIARAFPVYDNSVRASRKSPVQVKVAFSAPSAVNVERLNVVIPAIRLAAALVDAPTNEVHTDAMLDVATAIAGHTKSKISIIKGEDLEAGGYGGLWNVGKAATHLPALAVLSHHSTAPHAKTVVLCGKGIVYDTGGLSLKTPTAMPGMKRDMGGAAALLSAFFVAAKLGVEHNLHCVLCLAENSVASNAMRPDDIIKMYSGLTVEVNNTDAEGRLVLVDGIAHACKFLNPDILIDMATLTGAQGIATGRKIAALVSNSAELEETIVRAGRVSGDLAHPLLYCPEFLQDDLKSDVADMRNSTRDTPMVGTSVAAQFIASHFPAGWMDQKLWAHLDIAYPSFSGERGTGFGVAIIVNYLLDQLSHS